MNIKVIMDVTYKLILAFVTLILGIALIGPIATQTEGVTTLLNVVSESHNMIVTGYPAINETATYTVTNAPTGWQSGDCPLTDFSLANSTGADLTLTTDNTVDLSTGVYLLVDNEDTNASGAYGLFPTNKTYATYTYCGDDYLNSSWGRSVLDLISGFFAIALMLISVGLFYSIGKDLKII